MILNNFTTKSIEESLKQKYHNILNINILQNNRADTHYHIILKFKIHSHTLYCKFLASTLSPNDKMLNSDIKDSITNFNHLLKYNKISPKLIQGQFNARFLYNNNILLNNFSYLNEDLLNKIIHNNTITDIEDIITNTSLFNMDNTLKNVLKDLTIFKPTKITSLSKCPQCNNSKIIYKRKLCYSCFVLAHK